MKVLVACEESQRVCIAFREKGHEAYSCDIEPCSGGHPEWHIQQDVLPLLDGDCKFRTAVGAIHEIKGRWDMILAFPPCTHLTVACAGLWEEKRKDGRQQAAADFFMKMISANCPLICVENPVGYMNSHYRRPDQIIHPYLFGDQARKRTCLWLKGLPKLKTTEIVDQGEVYETIRKSGRRKGQKYNAPLWYQKLASNKDRGKLRSKTFPGIAKAMADQWGDEVNHE